MTTYIELTEKNVDGCGTDVSTTIEIMGSKPFNSGVIQKVKDAVNQFKKEVGEGWQTDELFSIAAGQISLEGYEVKYILPTVEIVL